LLNTLNILTSECHNWCDYGILNEDCKCDCFSKHITGEHCERAYFLEWFALQSNDAKKGTEPYVNSNSGMLTGYIKKIISAKIIRCLIASGDGSCPEYYYCHADNDVCNRGLCSPDALGWCIPLPITELQTNGNQRRYVTEALFFVLLLNAADKMEICNLFSPDATTGVTMVSSMKIASVNVSVNISLEIIAKKNIALIEKKPITPEALEGYKIRGISLKSVTLILQSQSIVSCVVDLIFDIRAFVECIFVVSF
uniref:EGF-like domain-containing protein n=1 Tax=Toxocara canis TaxID=6265 RepID=A0A183UP12_TOXCA